MLKFLQPPKACKTDNIADTICYGQIAEKIIKYCDNKEFHLIEFLGQEIFSLLRVYLDEAVKIKVSITKLNPPIVGIAASVCFEYADF